ncbi:outer membrane protein [Mesorhizobium sp. ANAO-SY3R2]|uniref:outer membrane protein n=1 Tax=Mesorhizobium sp. ANAO-SY3R2 TaxID=3166644 RepID=UPI00366E01DB
MILKSRAALALAATMLWPLAAQAADYEPPVVIEEAPEYVPVEVGSGWYLRGDVGYALSTSTGTASFRTFDDGPPIVYGQDNFTSQDIDNNFTWGGGVGYRFTDYLRADATVDGFRTDFSGTTASVAPCDPADVGTSCRTEGGAEMSAISVMANGYLDLGTYIGLTPYVGGGVGWSYVSWSNLNNRFFCVDDVNTCTVGLVGTDSHGGVSDWRFTYALMAGLAYDLTDNLKVDLGYKYRHIDGGDMFKWNSSQAAAGATGIQGKDGGLSQHEIRVGLRYEIW